MNKTVLVAGGAGYIGSHACKALAKAGYRPVAYDNLSRGHADAVKWGPLVEGNIGDKPHVIQTLRRYQVDCVMDFAAYAYVGESMVRPGLYFHNNVANTQALLDAMHDAGVKKFIFSSTCATYGIPETLPITEAAPLRPINPYGESKMMVEQMLRWYGQIHDFKFVTLRYFNAAGADPEGEIGEEHEPEPHLIPSVIEAALGQRSHIDIFGTDYPTPDGTAVRDFVHVQDLAEAHIRALEYLDRGGNNIALNLATGRGYSVREVIAAVERVTGRRVPRKEMPGRPGDPPILSADGVLARRVLGWGPHLSGLDDIIETAWNYHREQADVPRVASV